MNKRSQEGVVVIVKIATASRVTVKCSRMRLRTYVTLSTDVYMFAVTPVGHSGEK